ncbi:ATP-binding protein [Haloferula sp.]|uniref:ATP-binding protein n=1 Tax=Haloferula sp. TaxID=2497595 RepID=UPI003C71EDC6
MTTITVPRINDSQWDFRTLWRIWADATHAGDKVTLDFQSCDFLRANAVAFLGGLIRLLQYRGSTVWIINVGPSIRTNLLKNGFLPAFAGEAHPGYGNTVPFREDWQRDSAAYQNYLADHWLGQGWVEVSNALRDAIIERVAEGYQNAFDHSQSPVGSYTCGQFYPRKRELQLSIVDFGVGIPSNVRECVGEAEKAADSCMDWAFVRGNTTATKQGLSRGLGLDLLRDFIQVNGGKLEILSHDGYISVDQGGVSSRILPHPFEGTMVNIRISCDSRFYRLASENVALVNF